MKEVFFKFPSTPHLATLPGVEIRDDKVLSKFECDEFLQHNLTIEEKVDGANLGISFDFEGNIRTQNRGAYMHFPGSSQWKHLENWLTIKENSLFEHLSDRYILFGEWCYAKHSIFYDRLPDWFLGFDLYDKLAGRFLSSKRRNNIFTKMEIIQVPVIAYGHFKYTDLKNFLSDSKFTEQPAEGIYLRIDDAEWLKQRAKLVQPAFMQKIEQHWLRSDITPNRLIHF